MSWTTSKLPAGLNEFSTEDKVRIFHLFNSDSKRQNLLYETDMDSRMEIQETLDKNYLANLLDEMAEDEATDIIKEHSNATQEEILSKMEKQDAEVIKRFNSIRRRNCWWLNDTGFQQNIMGPNSR